MHMLVSPDIELIAHQVEIHSLTQGMLYSHRCVGNVTLASNIALLGGRASSNPTKRRCHL